MSIPKGGEYHDLAELTCYRSRCSRSWLRCYIYRHSFTKGLSLMKSSPSMLVKLALTSSHVGFTDRTGRPDIFEWCFFVSRCRAYKSADLKTKPQGSQVRIVCMWTSMDLACSIGKNIGAIQKSCHEALKQGGAEGEKKWINNFSYPTDLGKMYVCGLHFPLMIWILSIHPKRNIHVTWKRAGGTLMPMYTCSLW